MVWDKVRDIDNYMKTFADWYDHCINPTDHVLGIQRSVSEEAISAIVEDSLPVRWMNSFEYIIILYAYITNRFII